MPKVSLSEDLLPISDFRTHTAEVVEKMKRTGRPVILTQHGRSTAVLEDVREYERRAERVELLEAILTGIRAAEKRQVVSHAKAMAELDRALNA
jgi:prevent-host-death family protein